MVFVKGNNHGKGRPPGSPNKTTLLKEERRAIFEQKASEMWEETIKKLRPEYIADQFMGAAPKLVDLTTKGEKLPDAVRLEALIAQLEDELDAEEPTDSE